MFKILSGLLGSLYGLVERPLKLLLLLGLIFSSPIIMDEAKDIYWTEYAAKKANPVKFRDRVVASSFQLKYKGYRYTVTNKHVCDILKTPRGAEINRGYQINPVGKLLKIGDKMRRILAIDTAHDICILQPLNNSNAFKLASFWKPGERITLIGHPRGLPQTIREGRIVTKVVSRFFWVSVTEELETFMVDTITYGGNSGSPVVNRFGNLVGILFAGSRAYHTEALVVPLEAIEDFLDRYIEENEK